MVMVRFLWSALASWRRIEVNSREALLYEAEFYYYTLHLEGLLRDAGVRLPSKPVACCLCDKLAEWSFLDGQGVGTADYCDRHMGKAMNRLGRYSDRLKLVRTTATNYLGDYSDDKFLQLRPTSL